MAELTADPKAMTRRNFTDAMSSWAHVDPSAASEWLAAFPTDDPNWGAAYLGLVSGFAANDLDSATELALGIAEQLGDTAHGAIECLAESAVQQGGIEGVTDWIETVPEGEMRQVAFRHAANRVSRAGSEQFSEWLADQSAAQHRDDQVYLEHAKRLGAQDLAEAFRWAIDLNPSPQTGERTALPELVDWIRAADRTDELRAWLERNSSHPSAEALRTLLNP
jgi:hypothetical protein